MQRNHDSGTDGKTETNDIAGIYYTMEELLPVVRKLAEKYTSREHTSVSYETAEMLMEAVLYCIREAETASCDSPSAGAPSAGASAVTLSAGASADISSAGALPAGTLPAEQAYAVGAAAVREKVNAALSLYNEMIPDFLCYENRCLLDTFVRGMPEFFKWYDIRFKPQDTILTLDYPVLRNLSKYSGIDRIYEYILCIRLEQEFLSMFPEDYVIRLLSQGNGDYRDRTENLCEIVLTSLAKHMLDEPPLTECDLWQTDCLRKDTDSRHNHCLRKDADSRHNDCLYEDASCRAAANMPLQDLRRLLRDRLADFLQAQYGENGCDGKDGRASRLADYLGNAIDDIAVRLKHTFR